MGLRKDILKQMSKRGKEITMKELCEKFPDQPKTTVRGRVYESIGKGITRLGRGLYISSDAIIEQGDSLEIIDRMVEEGDVFDFVFLDIPYKAGGQKGGNRNLFDKDKITPEQFGVFVSKVEKLLRTDDSPIAYMFTSGRSSKAAHDRYFKQFDNTELQLCDKIGTWTKLWANGNRMNMGKYLMPPENIYFFSRSGKVDVGDVDFSLSVKFKEYPSVKPYPMIKSLVEQLTKVGDWVLDPFGGSGKILKACLELNRKCHIIDSDDVAINNHILKLV